MRFKAKFTLLNTFKLLLALITAFSIVGCSNAKTEENNDFEITTSAGSHRPDWADGASTFRISVSNEDDGTSKTTVEVFEGSVQTTALGEEITVKQGESLTIDGTNMSEGTIDTDSLPDKTKDKLNDFAVNNGAE